MLSSFKQIYAYRSLLRNLVHRDQKAQYKNTLLGFVWSFLNPLLLMLVFVVVFGKIGRFADTIPNYPIFLLIGILTWRFFTSSLLASSSSLRESSALLLKVAFPRQIVPVASVTTNLVTLLYSLIVLFVLFPFFDIPFTVYFFYLPLIILCQYIMLIGAGYIFSVLSTFYQDVSYLLNVVLTMGFFLTPIFYSINKVPDNMVNIFRLNPMVNFIIAYRRILLYGKSPGILTCAFILCFTLLTYALGVFIFSKLQARVMEKL